MMLTLTGCTQTAPKQASTAALQSPAQQAELMFSLSADGKPQYALSAGGQVIVDTSTLGLRLGELADLTKGLRIVNTRQDQHRETWEQPWGEQRQIEDNYNALTVTLQSVSSGITMEVTFRLFDDGLGIRYHLPAQQGLNEFVVTEEVTQFVVSPALTAWWTPAQAGNQYEYLYQHTPITDIPLVHTPVTLIAKNGFALALHEAALHDYTTMNLRWYKGALQSELVSWSPDDAIMVRASGELTSPWRTVMWGDSVNALTSNYLTLNLNEPNKLGDVSWVKPGKYVGIWWELHLEKGSWKQGDKHGATTANTKKYIDFAAQHGFDGVLVEGWNVGWDGEWFNHGGGAFRFTEAYPDYDLEEVNRYAHGKGVYIIGHHETGAAVDNYDAQLEDAYSLLEQQGMKAVKTGYVETGELLTSGQNHHGQYFVRHADRVTEMAAKHHIMLVAHETLKDTGERRTYPNFLSREVARGQEYDAWATDGGNPPSHTTILPYTRLLSGPMDFTPGIFDISLPSRPDNQVNTTLAKQLALYVVIYSPVQMAADLPENYARYPDAFQFIKDVPVDWEQSATLQGEIGKFVVTARQQRNGDDWYVGAITNEQARNISLPLSFLAKDKTYQMTLYADAADADYQTNPEAYDIISRQVKHGDVVSLQLAAGGGAAVQFTALD